MKPLAAPGAVGGSADSHGQAGQAGLPTEPALAEAPATPGERLGALLREGRQSRGFSQMELGLRLGVSQRHICFVELGRSRPSRALLTAWLQEAGSEPSAVNGILLQGGYPLSQGGARAGCADAAAEGGLQRMIAAHDPNPAFIFGGDWTIREFNQGGAWLTRLVMPGYLQARTGASERFDMLDCLLHPNGLLSQMINADRVGAALVAQLRLEALAAPELSMRVDRLEAELVRRYGALSPEPRPGSATDLNVEFATELGRLTFFTVQCIPAIPQNVGPACLRVELWYPVDGRTRRLLTDALAA